MDVTPPENIIAIVEEEALRHLNCVDDAVIHARDRIRALPEYEELIDLMFNTSVLEWIYAARHRNNVKIKRAAGHYGSTQRKATAASQGVLAAYQSVYDYCIGGGRLGDLLGKDLDRIVKHERSVATGHLFNAALVDWVCSEYTRKRVSLESPVKEAVPERDLRRKFDALYREIVGGEAPSDGNVAG